MTVRGTLTVKRDRDRGGFVVRGTLAVRETPMVRWALAVMRAHGAAHDSHRGPYR